MRTVFINKLALFLLFVAGSLFGAENYCYFIPPQGWMPAEKETLSSLVKISFVDPKNFGFRGSLNLAEEEIDCSLEEYLLAVKKIHTSDHHNTWSNLGHFPTKAGPAVLTQIDSVSSGTPIRVLQVILVRDDKAYILTAAAAKKQFSKYLDNFKTALGSLTLTDDLLSMVEDQKKREKIADLQAAYFKGEESSWENYQSEILNGCKELGPYWQALAIHETLNKK